MSDDKPYRLRIPPSSPRQHHVMGTAQFTRGAGPDRGWYPITEEQKRALEKVPLFDTSPSSSPLFQIVTAEESLQIDQSEARKGSPEATAAEMRAELRETKTKLAEIGDKLDAVLSAIGTHADKLPPELEQLGAIGKSVIASKAPKPDDVDSKPARPGAKGPQKADGGKPAPTKGPQKAEDRDKDDPVGARAAAEGYDDSLRQQGFTVNR